MNVIDFVTNRNYYDAISIYLDTNNIPHRNVLVVLAKDLDSKKIPFDELSIFDLHTWRISGVQIDGKDVNIAIDEYNHYSSSDIGY